MDYRAPDFKRPTQYDVPDSLEGIFAQYQRMTAEKEQSNLQGLALREKYGTDPRGMTPEQLDRGFAGPTITPAVPQGPYPDNMVGLPTPARPEQTTFDNNPHVAAIQRHIQARKQGAATSAKAGQVEIENKAADTELKLANADKARREPVTGGLDPAKRAELSNKLRDDLNKASTPFVTMRNYYAKIQTASKDPTGASDWALVYGFNKMLDEGSAVRDPEVQNTIDTGSFTQSLRAAVVRLESGKKLDDTVRANLVAESEKLFRAMEPYNERTVGQYRSIARRQGLDERDVVIDSSFIETPGGNAGASEEVELKDGKGGTRIALYNGPKFVGWKK